MSEDQVLRPGKNCWRVETAERFAFVVDGADYFVALRKALLKARHSIMLVGWDFDTRIDIGECTDGGPQQLGDFILWLADRTPSLEIRLLRWDTGAFKALLRGNMLWTILRWKAHPRITLKFDAKHPVAGSHHQKIVAIDDSLAFCGGIDLTMRRWDTREHLDNDPRRVSPSGKTEDPWHDATSAFDGDAARAIGDLARTRWLVATGETLPRCQQPHDCWPEGLNATFNDMRLGIARTIPKMAGQEPVHEIEAAWLDMIRSARRHIYAESQYFASRKIARAIAERLCEADPPEIVIVTPQSAHGWLEPLAMDSARARLVQALERIDHRRRLSIWHPRTTGGQPIYVHAKVMVVDDTVLRVGSSNFNNRSMRLDSECDVILCADAGDDVLRLKIAQLRDDLLAEHLGIKPEQVSQRLAETGSLIETVEQLGGPGRSLYPYQIPELSGIEEWLAENEILDPNGPDEIFESIDKRGLFKGWDRIKARFPHRQKL
ncbi:cardiolipin synthase B [Brucella sp. NBRC 12952]|jgi:phosphatidylserine/phosphatidylglycerophosphate/cardiolipin synthase-like enzyme|uniref:phospholipase D-like domain-containing protein n=1 Tax=Brucella TaxID=234 RepID=UPI000DDF5646|nr:phospholipase D-like domain-containing protein [Brucella sp.]MBK0022841.1 phospholipase [Ochrobactrum sp. S45]MBK0044856.1 phospholipase [Ochrobactrum sp. S46]